MFPFSIVVSLHGFFIRNAKCILAIRPPNVKDSRSGLPQRPKEASAAVGKRRNEGEWITSPGFA